jgi:putative FmdB family regulatory protein
MPLYEFYCRKCNEKFTQLRPIATAGEPSKCDSGHKAMTVLTTAAVFANGLSADVATAEAPSTGGGCACGRGSCGCGDF